MSPPQGGCGPLVFVAGLVLTFINTVAFGRRCIPPRGVARRSNTLGILPPRALRGAPLGRRVDRAYARYVREEQRSQRGCIAGRMQAAFHHGLLGLRGRVPGAIAGFVLYA